MKLLEPITNYVGFDFDPVIVVSFSPCSIRFISLVHSVFLS